MQRDALALLLDQEGLAVESYPSAQGFLAAYCPERPGCLVLDIRMPGMDGLELQDTLAAQKLSIPIIFITGHGDISMSVRALKAGAVDFIEKPFEDEELLNRIREAIVLDAGIRQNEIENSVIRARFGRLTPREQEVMALMVTGKRCKDIAKQLDVSYRTVETHRSRVLHKMEADSLLELATMVTVCGIRDSLA